jgi:hypothetical protein
VAFQLLVLAGKKEELLVGAAWWRQEQRRVELLGIELPCNSLSLL